MVSREHLINAPLLKIKLTPSNFGFLCSTAKCQCKIAARERRNCGPPGISAADCRKAGCCFNASVPGVPWCFTAKPKKVKKVCPADPRIRVNCGYPGITAKECLSRRCCFRAHPAGVPWCFYHRTVEEGC
uniref:Trefoil factor 2 n=1 Tax=Meleagris gallopavo TaxID=9103 RepID=A0A803YLV9_MELGA